MKYTDKGLQVSLEELKKICAYAENRAKHDSMEPTIYISGGDRPTITQYCCYAECNPINHTWGAQ